MLRLIDLFHMPSQNTSRPKRLKQSKKFQCSKISPQVTASKTESFQEAHEQNQEVPPEKGIRKTKKVFTLSPLRAQLKLNHIANGSKCYKLAAHSPQFQGKQAFQIQKLIKNSSLQQSNLLINLTVVAANTQKHPKWNFGSISAAFWQRFGSIPVAITKFWHQSGLQTNSKQSNNLANNLASHSTS